MKATERHSVFAGDYYGDGRHCWIKGSINPMIAVDVARREFFEGGSIIDGVRGVGSFTVSHVIIRVIPPSPGDEYAFTVSPAPKGQRGAFAATLIECDAPVRLPQPDDEDTAPR